MKNVPKIFITYLLLLPTFVFAQGSYENLIKLPIENDSSFGGYINALYFLAISIAAILAVLKLIIAGVKYMLTDVVTSKQDAKNDIKGALLGLLLIISAVLILNTINSSITDNDVDFIEVELSGERIGVSGAGGNGGISSLQTAQSQADAVAEAAVTTNDCATTRKTVSGAGQNVITLVDASACTNEEMTAVFAAAKSACTGLWKITDSNPKVGGCATSIGGVLEANQYTEDIASVSIIGGETVETAECTTTNGNVVVLNAVCACGELVKDMEDGTAKENQFNFCLSGLETKTAMECDGTGAVYGEFGNYGIYDGSNNAALKCTLPVSKKITSTLTEAFTKYQADGNATLLTIDDLSATQEEELCEEYAKGRFFDDLGTDNTCAFYQ